MTNPFDDPDGTYVVLMNGKKQYSLWPVIVDVPAGWQIVHPADTHAACLDYINKTWTDMRPGS